MGGLLSKDEGIKKCGNIRLWADYYPRTKVLRNVVTSDYGRIIIQGHLENVSKKMEKIVFIYKTSKASIVLQAESHQVNLVKWAKNERNGVINIFSQGSTFWPFL